MRFFLPVSLFYAIITAQKILQLNRREEMNKRTMNLTMSAMFLAVGLILPFLTGQIPQIGNMMLPMHIPVLLCGLICGWQYGAAVGFVLPLLRYLIFGMPVLFPTGMAMAFELMTYGLVVGLLYSRSRWKCIVALYRALLGAMIAGRIVWAIAQTVLLGLSGSAFTWEMFMAGAFLNAVPGIIIQLILIPSVMVALRRTGMIRTENREESRKEMG